MSRRIIPVLLIVAVALAAALPASAQDGGLSADQQALVQRVLDGAAASDSYTSVALTRTRSEHQITTLSVGTAEIASLEERTTSGTVTFARDAAGVATFSDLFTLQISEQGFNDSAPTEYTLSGERRGVGDTLYVNVTRTSADDSALPPMPDGWIAVTDPAEFPALDALKLDATLDQLGHPSIYDDSFADLLAHVTSASVEARTLDDGTPVDTIALRIEGPELIAALMMLAETPADNTAAQTYYGAIDPASAWSMTFDVNTAGENVHFTADVTVTWTDFDATILSDSLPAGTLLNQTVTQTGDFTLSGINAPADPFLAPEV